jgi:branched-chain amino acid transport system permease protein
MFDVVASRLRRHAEVGWRSSALVVVVVLAGLPAFLSSYNVYRVEVVVLYATAALGLALVLGYAGELLLVQPAVIAVSAYTTALLDLHLGLEPLLALPIAVVAGALVGLVVGSTGIRVQGLYLGIISFFAVVILGDLAQMTESWSGGEAGLAGLSSFHIGGLHPDWLLYEVAVLILVLSYVGARQMVRSGWGLRLRALRESPRALLSSGVNLSATKVGVYVISAIPGALVGWLFPYVNRSVGTQFFGLSFTLLLLAAVELGGRNTLLGAVVAAAALQTYSLVVGPFSEYNTIGLGAVLLLVVVAFPRGLGGIIRRRASTPRAATRPKLATIGQTSGLADPAPSQTLEVRGVSKHFGGNQALSLVDITLRPGAIVALIGGNGSGKTTLVNVITGMLHPDEGEVLLGGSPIHGKRPDQIGALGVGRTFQLPQLISDLTARENVEVGLLGRLGTSGFGAMLRPRRSAALDAQRAADAERALETIDLDPALMSAPVETLPLGMKRIVEVARALASGAGVVLLDEPAAGLNEDELDRLGRLLDELRSSGKAVLFVEHNVPFVLAHSDEVVLLESGRVAASFQNQAGAEMPAALRAYLDHVPSLRDAGQPEVAR